ncbi:VanZ family protein [Streptomyces sp. NPDC012389]|uniref:VanZ family protein n=1 Tax=Streptomyces sp. NPDC012389 TaxID=3364830 RepID=UPI0036F055FD
MISASVGALQGVVPLFLLLAVLLAVPAVVIARARQAAVLPGVAAAVFFAGAFAVTLTPGGAGGAATNMACVTGTSPGEALRTTPGVLNALLFAPACFFLVRATRRPLTSLAVICLAVPGVEWAQAAFPLGRTCTYSDLTLNCAGAALGWAAGLLTAGLARKNSPLTRRDLIRGGGPAAAGALVMLALFSALTPIEGPSEGLGVSAAQDRWAREAAAGVYGDDARVVQVQLRPALPHEPVRIDVTTDLGSLTLSWPDRKILTPRADDRRDDGGDQARTPSATPATVRPAQP